MTSTGLPVEDSGLGSDLTCFVIGPIGDKLSPLGSEPRMRYENATQMWANVFEPAAHIFGLTPVRSDKIAEQGEIPEQIFALLRDADVVIADLTGGNANVMYELGMRHTREKLTIQVGEVGSLPFDVNTIRTIKFVRTEAGLLDARESLTEALRAGLSEKSKPVTATRLWAELVTSDRSTFEAAAAKSDVGDDDEEGDSETPGLMDTLAEGELALVRVTELSQRSAEIMQEYAALSTDATEEIHKSDANRGGFAGRLRIATALAAELLVPATEMDELSLDYEREVHLIDLAMKFFISYGTENAAQLDEMRSYLTNVLTLTDAAGPTNISTTSLIHSIKGLRRIAKVLAPVETTMIRGLSRILAANQIIESWGDEIRSIDGWGEGTALTPA